MQATPTPMSVPSRQTWSHLVGIFGNISDEDLETTIHGAPSSVVQVPTSCGPIQSDAVNDRARRRSTTSMSARAIAPSSACAM
jgi:hypothetical protein